MKTILIYGHYGHQNIGDELFKESFEILFNSSYNNYNLIFTDFLNIEMFKNVDALIFGGGSFLNQPISGFNIFDFNSIINSIPIFYIGVGLETEIHADHWYFLNQAKLVASRTEDCLKLNSYKKQLNIIDIPDLVYLLKDKINNCEKHSNSVLILPNVSVLPLHNSPAWVNSSWENFKNQFAQFLDYLVDEKYNLTFYPMCSNKIEHDNFASYQIISMMKHRDYNMVKSSNYQNIYSYLSSAESVITQRYHGIILSELANVPVLPIYHHDKLKVTDALPYYEISKDRLLNNFWKLKNKKKTIDYSAFNQVKNKVEDILKSNG